MLTITFSKRLYPLLRSANINSKWNLMYPPKNIIIPVQCSVIKQVQISHVFTFLCIKIISLLLSETEFSKRSPAFWTQGKTFWLQKFPSCSRYSTPDRVCKNEIMKRNMVALCTNAILLRINYCKILICITVTTTVKWFY